MACPAGVALQLCIDSHAGEGAIHPADVGRASALDGIKVRHPGWRSGIHTDVIELFLCFFKVLPRLLVAGGQLRFGISMASFKVFFAS